MLRIPVGPLRKGETFANRFDHMNAGTDRDENQRISTFAGAEIFPFLSDHYVIDRAEYLSVPECPSEGTPGHVEFEIRVHHSAHQGSLTGLALVLYGEKRGGGWTILAGADPGSREFTEPTPVVEISDPDDPPVVPLNGRFTLEDDVKRVVIRLFSFGKSSQGIADEDPGPVGDEQALECP